MRTVIFAVNNLDISKVESVEDTSCVQLFIRQEFPILCFINDTYVREA